MANGTLHSLYAVPETVYGQTPADPALELVRITGTTLALSKESLQSAEIRGDRQIADFRLGANSVGGEIQFELSCKSFDKFLQGVLLSEPWATASGVTPAAEQIKSGLRRQSFTFVRRFGDLSAGSNPYFIYRGCEINQFQLTISANAMVTGSFNLIGQGQEVAADLSGMGTPTYPAASTTAPLDSFTGALKEKGSVIAVITEITLNLQNGIESRFVVGKKDSILPSLGRSNLTGQITAYFEDSSLVSKFVNEEESSIEFEMPDADGNKQTYIVPRLKYTGGQPDVSGEGPIMLSMPFQAMLDPTTGTNFIIRRNKA